MGHRIFVRICRLYDKQNALILIIVKNIAATKTAATDTKVMEKVGFPLGATE
jgi:hypothetical protein